ncbi:Protein of unknown function [Escherichia coli]|nr:Protein of unknown function [Escherichia coli D6-113.11]CDP72750.1 Protein of unknown function [Escherichia coli]CDU35338.1 Protein of unknown function [Escherichia coli D6-113.11]CDU39941.1 Protein of unknown function [Escherichia coli]
MIQCKLVEQYAIT